MGPLGLIGKSTKGEPWWTAPLGEDLEAAGATIGVVKAKLYVDSGINRVRVGVDTSASVTQTTGDVSVTIGPIERNVPGKTTTRDTQARPFGDKSNINVNSEPKK